MKRPGGVETFGSSDISVAWLLGAEALPNPVDPGRAAVVWEGGALTYSELRQQSLAMAKSLRDSGVQTGETIVSHLFNRGEIFILYFACAYAGITLVPANFRLTSPELAGIIEDSAARMIFTEREIGEVCRGAVELTEHAIPVVELDLLSGGTEFAAMTAGPALIGPFARHNPHIVLFSSGTTGRPKGVMLHHESIMRYAATQALSYPGYRRGMRLLNVPAMFNTGGINEICIPTFMVGGTVYILPSRGWSAQKMVDCFARWQITHTVIFPTMFSSLLALDESAAVGMETLEMVITGGEACPPATMQAFRDRWPHVDLVIAYGLTEGGLVSLFWGDESVARPGAVGRSAVGSTFKIGDAEGNPIPPGQIGEIWVASDAVADGYWNAPKLDVETFRDGWFKTGDLGRVDDEGYLYLEGRSRQVVISRGQNIFPAEVEATLLEHPDILDVAVVGVPDAEAGEAVCAVVVLARGVELAPGEVVEWVATRIASYKKPKHVVFAPELPVTVSQKVDKLELAKIVTQALGLAQVGPEGAQLGSGRRPEDP